MKQKIRIKMLGRPFPIPEITKKGDWIDLRAAEDVVLAAPYATQARKNVERKVIFEQAVIPLGVAMQLPKGYEAIVNSRSSIYKNFFVMLVNGQGVIDNSYCGDNDQWFAQVLAFADTKIEAGDRICQFRIQLSQKATFWQKLKWFFSSGVKIEIVDELGNPNRGGHGHSGVK